MSSDQDNTTKDMGDAGSAAGASAGDQGSATGAAQGGAGDVQAGGDAHAAAGDGQAEGAAEALSQDEILILRDTDTTAAAVAHLAAARLHALLSREDDEPGVDMAWFDVRGEFAVAHLAAGQAREQSSRVQKRLEGLSLYVRQRLVTNPEQLYLHDGGKSWATEPAAYRQALELFCHVVLTTAVGMERRKGELERVRRLEAETAVAQPLKLEDSIFEPEANMGEMLPHVVEALKRPGKPVDPSTAKRGAETAEPIKPMSVGEAPAGLKQPAKPAKSAKAKNSR